MNSQFVVIFSILFEQAWSANMACQEVRYAYSAKGMNVYDVPLKPQSGKIYEYQNPPNIMYHANKSYIIGY